MPADESVTVKGSPVRSLQKFLANDLTAEQRAAVFGSLPPEYSTRFSGPILPTETVPVHMINVLTETAATIKGEPLESFAIRAGREAAGDAVTGIYRFFAMVLTPTALLSKASQMWSALYNRGQLRVESESNTGAHIVLANFPSELAGCSRMTGWIERIARLTGVTDIDVQQTKCFAKGDPNCEWQITWK